MRYFEFTINLQVEDLKSEKVRLKDYSYDSPVDAVAYYLFQKLTNGVVLLCAIIDDKVSIVAKASKEAVAKGVHAGKLIKEAATAVGGGGGGRPEMAQAGGKDPEKIPQAMEAAHKALKAQLGLE